MDRVRIDVPGWDGFTGALGGVPFTDGISDRPLTPQEIARIGANMRIVKLDGDGQVGPGMDMIAAESRPAPILNARPEEAKPEPTPVVLEYDRERLEKLAEDGGIKAVREVATKFGVKGVQISQLIDGILEAQKGK